MLRSRLNNVASVKIAEKNRSRGNNIRKTLVAIFCIQKFLLFIGPHPFAVEKAVCKRPLIL